MKLLVHSIQGPENSVNAVFPIAIASIAAGHHLIFYSYFKYYHPEIIKFIESKI